MLSNTRECTSQKILFILKDLSLVPLFPHLLSSLEVMFTRTGNLKKSLICFTCAPPLLVYLNLCMPYMLSLHSCVGLTFCALFAEELKP